MSTVLAVALATFTLSASLAGTPETTLGRARRVVEEVRAASYPELRDADIQIREFASKSDYFQCRPDLRRAVVGRKMRYIVFVNPRVFELGAPEAGVRAIVAHELGHVLYYRRGCRLRLLGLTRLVSSGYRARFERWADLQALSRGHAEGLKAYRRWLYTNVPASRLDEKRRDYFSPEEIDAIETAAKDRPQLYDAWRRHVPRSLAEIEASAGAGRP